MLPFDIVPSVIFRIAACDGSFTLSTRSHSCVEQNDTRHLLPGRREQIEGNTGGAEEVRLNLESSLVDLEEIVGSGDFLTFAAKQHCLVSSVSRIPSLARPRCSAPEMRRVTPDVTPDEGAARDKSCCAGAQRPEEHEQHEQEDADAHQNLQLRFQPLQYLRAEEQESRARGFSPAALFLH